MATMNYFLNKMKKKGNVYKCQDNYRNTYSVKQSVSSYQDVSSSYKTLLYK